MRFGYVVRDPSNQTYSEIRDLTVKVEKLGFESVHVTDHFFRFGDMEKRKTPFLESNILLAALARETQKIKLAHIVMCNSFRNPAQSAKIILTLDHLSNGRALLWVGAGWFKEEYDAYGYPFPSAKRIVDEFEESLTIFKKVFTEDITNFEGNFWKLENHINYPKSIQKPYPQIVVGTNTGKRMIDIACREADGVNLANIVPRDQKMFNESISLINERLKKYGRDFEEFETSIYTYVRIVDSQETLEKVRKEKGIFKSVMKYQFMGDLNTIQEKIQEVEDLGVKKMVIILESPVIDDPFTLFGKELM